MYSFDSRVRFSETNADKRLGLTAIINYFQDCSSFQSEAIDAGFAFLAKRGRAWIISSWELEIIRYPVFNEKITVGTWPTEFKGMFGYRNYILQSEAKETLAVAYAVWVYLDTASLRPARILPEDSAPYLPSLEPPYPMQIQGRKIPLPDSFLTKEIIPVTPAHLDTNQHVNNGQYIAMAESFLPKDFIPHRMRAEYRKSAVLGDVIHPRVTAQDSGYTVALSDTAGTPYAIIEFK